ncbi:PAS domain-containing protein [Microbulbifer sp. SH-1]|uniref:TyrR/PhhR family helix-turn-helix DNA-binding protein n=1 Tax=Microbulbifer sp. SH-1 TaxID=2681547 RepID=UPI001407AE1D|nr:TyrR/PhhR family helix-turn-helix DNA-binding protein [Microbulbifer sp. SH-1]QIL89047.1 PAS domain-containing protein [Microbulbifer sp. SH-1]
MRIEITCSDRLGILQEIMAIFADFRISVRSGEIGGDSGDKVYLSAPGLLMTQYQSIERALHRVPGVRKVRRIALIPSERRHFELDTLLRHVAFPVLSVDREGTIVAANLAAARAFGVSQGQVAGMHLQRFLPRLQLEELLRGITAPRYGFPVTMRGRDFLLDWSPIALADDPGEVRSLAGAVLTLQQREEAPERDPSSEPPPPSVLWDIDRRRECCLRLQQLAPLRDALLIAGERGSGKSTFLGAGYYLSPLAEHGQVRQFAGAEFAPLEVAEAAAMAETAVLLVDDLDLAPDDSQRSLAERLLRGRFLPRLVVSARSLDSLYLPLRQLLAANAISLPPLRSMRPAIGKFAHIILRDLGDRTAPLPADVVSALQRHDWPTNFTGLRGHLQGALAHRRERDGGELALGDLPGLPGEELLPWRDWGRGLSLPEQMEKVERTILAEVLAEMPASQRSSRELARRLGISHTAVANKLRKYGLS